MLLSQHPTHLGEADHPSYRRGVTPQPRREIPAAVQAALWALSNGHCYAPGCPFPVVYEVRPGVFKKNAQIAHIHAVKPNAPRYRPCTTDEERQQRDAFTNLILVCLAHHAAIDDKKDGERLYPPETLREWKRKHEGKHGPALARLAPMSDEQLGNLLGTYFTAPITRLEAIADQLEQTGELTADSLEELRRIIAVLQENPLGPDARTASSLAYAADLLSMQNLSSAASSLSYAADVLSVTDVSRAASSLRGAADVLSSILRDLDRKISQLHGLM